MRWLWSAELVLAILIAGAPSLSALAGQANIDRDRAAAPSETASPSPNPKLTGKERLGPKWTDEQRIDNCNIPPDKRGIKPRPDCPHPSR